MVGILQKGGQGRNGGKGDKWVFFGGGGFGMGLGTEGLLVFIFLKKDHR